MKWKLRATVTTNSVVNLTVAGALFETACWRTDGLMILAPLEAVI
jgi:hypothetical protein